MTDTAQLMVEAASLQGSGQLARAVSMYETVFLTSARSRNVAVMVEAARRIGYVYQLSGEIDVATEYLVLACTLAEVHGERIGAARALNGLATIYQSAGEISLAEKTYHAAIAVSESVNDTQGLGDIQLNLGTLAGLRGRHADAIRYYEASRRCYSTIGYERGIAHVMNNLGMLQLDFGRVADAAFSIDAALKISHKNGDSLSAAAAYLNRAEVHIVERQYDQGRFCCEEAFELARLLEDNRLYAETHKYLGIICRETKRPSRAAAHLRRSIRLAKSSSLPLTEAEALRELALVWRASERNAEALTALHRAHLLFSQLQAIHDQAEVSNRLTQLEEDFLDVVRHWSLSIGQKDVYTRDHCERVANYACILARSAGIAEAELVWFRMGAFLHDVGKTEVPEAILHKRGVLTPAERAIIERHTLDGDKLLASVPFPWDIRPMVRSHHERWDGNGYPDGLAGEEIPLAARILRLADVFDALTTSRSYREPLTSSQAREVMREDIGAFDPALFAHFEDLFTGFAGMAETARKALPLITGDALQDAAHQ